MSLSEQIKEKFGSAILGTHNFRGDDTLVVPPGSLHQVLRHLKENPEFYFNVLMDLTAVDYQTFGDPGLVRPDVKEGKGSRFEVVYHLYSMDKNHRLRVKVPVEEADCVMPTATDLWAAADWYEREIWDMFGIRFEGHPNLKRILMYEEFVGHPLRKDYPVNKRQPLIGPQH